jgi:hypothetical protein
MMRINTQTNKIKFVRFGPGPELDNLDQNCPNYRLDFPLTISRRCQVANVI